ncbi:Bifunctional riboflavin biosynthesis protein RIBA 1, chloroplastic [Candidatus Protochlamydia amoebophila]|uniref:bifunctional 3,4-dihydroxy-2-butanone-4-phosphate synthase/GTP cyclohydrolase II n=1 Tax=Candidatus Protochlamydia amoebophila TaxID=362787 RepID=UPI001BCA25E9|nr:bifunctional 3,4-dihydroxy-2-butanone-4-phosphate synthase/GTP cyclohydrolase II [Candidatus Protochlamydia amoebophila]MBS4162838.1 Bifunctional riboflavin biosynthesis protein RIBA 1, chloroplastic [Candidatus Protochlamydia amoebophila]
MKTYRLEDALLALKEGKFVIVVDDENRENEGDLILAAEKAHPSSLGFMIRHTTGIICLAMKGQRLDELKLPPMVTDNTDRKQTAFTVSVDYLHQGVTTGVSAEDRTKTILSLIHSHTKPEDLGRPGHIFPLRYKEGGVLKRAGHTEAAVDLTNLAKLYPAGILAELINEDGSMMRLPELEKFSDLHQIPIITIAELIRFRRRHEKLVSCFSQSPIPTPFGDFNAYVYESQLDGIQHIALVKGEIKNQKNILVRMHSECLTGDVFGSKRCDCGSQLKLAMEKIEQEGRGVIIYLRGHEGRGIGIGHKLKAYNLQDQGKDTLEANLELGFPIDSREYGIGAQILVDLGLSTIRLMTNNLAKYNGLTGYDLEITERVPLPVCVTKENKHYLQTKKDKLGHLIDLSEDKLEIHHST